MSAKAALYNEVQDFAQSAMGDKDYFACIYGSYATSHFRPESDLDILFAEETYEQDDFEKIKEFVVSLHVRNGLTIDEEVPYQNKLLVPYADIDRAVSLDAFKKEEHAKFVVPIIQNDAAFLGSQEVRSRLVLNALTTPNVFVSGNETMYRGLRAKCESALVQLARGLIDITDPNPDDLQKALLVGAHGETGQAHLGYKVERDEVVIHLGEIIGRTMELEKN